MRTLDGSVASGGLHLAVDDDEGVRVRPRHGFRQARSTFLFAAAPVLPNGVAILGEVDKWATMSSRRVESVAADGSTATAVLLGAPGEVVVISYAVSGALAQVRCQMPAAGSSSCRLASYGDVDCTATLHCTSAACACV